MHSQIGAGHFAKVWLARRCYGEAECVVKVVKLNPFAEILRRRQSCVGVTDEAVILATLSHPHIIRMLEWRFTPHTLFLLIEYMPGGYLKRHIIRSGKFSDGNARRCFRMLASAMEYLFQKEIVHRDVKPENMLFKSPLFSYYDDSETTDSIISLIDFGSATFEHEVRLLKVALRSDFTPIFYLLIAIYWMKK